MGYATVAGLPVEIGLYTCIFPMLIYALFGTARRLSFSTTSTIVALTGLAITAADPGSTDLVGTATTLTLMVGVLLIVFRLIRLGWMLEAVSEATLAGLKVGVGLTIIADQLPKLLGIPSTESDFFGDVWNAIEQLPEANFATVLIGGLDRRVPPGSQGMETEDPRAIAGFGSRDRPRGFHRGDGSRSGDHPRGPHRSSAAGDSAIPASGGIAPVCTRHRPHVLFRDRHRGTDRPRARRPPIDNDQEYVATGLATIVGSFFRTVAPAGGFSQTQVNTNAEARTQVSELVTVVLAVAVTLLAPVLGDLPEATLGAIVVVAVLGLIKVDEMRWLGVIDPLEFWIAAITAFVALAFNLLIGVLVGVFLTIYFVLRTLNHPVVVELKRAPTS